MAFLEINGWTVPIANASAVRSTVKKGGRSRSPRGALRSSERKQKAKYAIMSPCNTFEEAEALEGLVNGEGHVFNFTSGLYAHTGLGPEPDYIGMGLDVGYATDDILGSVTVSSPSTFSLRYNAQLVDRWTVQWREYDGASWSIATLISDGTGWLDGVLTAGVGSTATALGIEVLDGVVRLSYSGTGTLSRIADLVILPFDVTSDIVAGFHAFIHAFSPLPKLKVDGDITPIAKLFHGKVTSSPYTQGTKAGTFENNLMNVSFQLVEVEDLTEPATLVSAGNAILTEAADYLTTEAGDHLIQE